MRAVVVNHYLQTMGGGEASSIWYAQALHDLGIETCLATLGHPTPKEKIVAWLGRPFGCEIVSLATEVELKRFCAPMDIAFNHTFQSYEQYSDNWNAVVVMFPGGNFSSPQLDKIDLFVAISKFTERYTRLVLKPSLPIRVVYPPAFHELPKGVQFDGRPNRIIHVGRFSVHGHVKNQHIIADIFRQSVNQGLVPPDTELRFMGVVNENPQTFRYVEVLQKQCLGYNIHFDFNAPRSVLEGYLRESKVYVHATGFSADASGVNPAYCEHYGISPIEAMLHGVVPLVYARGGPLEYVSHGENGMLFHARDDAAESLGLLMKNEDLRLRLARAARSTGEKFSYETFMNSLNTVLFGSEGTLSVR